MSLGGSGSEPNGAGCATGEVLHDAVCRSVAAGVTSTVAAGNSSADAAGFVPAAYNEVVTVSSLADFNGRPGVVRRRPAGRTSMTPWRTPPTTAATWT
jgi:subtilisin